MGPAAEELAQALESVEFAPVHAPVVANVDAAVHTRGADWPALCLAQLTGPVHWHGVLGTLRDTAGCARLLDVGPGRTMAGLARRAVPELAVQRADQLLPSPSDPARAHTLPVPAPAPNSRTTMRSYPPCMCTPPASPTRPS